MITIGLTGFSGTGKSTLAETLSKILPNAKYAAGDKWMFASREQFKNLAKEMWGDEIFKPKEQAPFECVFSAGEKGRQFMRETFPWINEQVTNEIKKADTEGYDYFVYEWTLLPTLDVWNKLDLKGHVASPANQRHYMLSQRPERGCSIEQARVRDEFVSHLIENLGNNYLKLTNDFTPEALQHNLNILVENMPELDKNRKEQISKAIKCINLSKYKGQKQTSNQNVQPISKDRDER